MREYEVISSVFDKRPDCKTFHLTWMQHLWSLPTNRMCPGDKSNHTGLNQLFRKWRHKNLALSPEERDIPPKETIITDFRLWKMDTDLQLGGQTHTTSPDAQLNISPQTTDLPKIWQRGWYISTPKSCHNRKMMGIYVLKKQRKLPALILKRMDGWMDTVSLLSLIHTTLSLCYSGSKATTPLNAH